jgi:uncharacterized membrane protein YdfJ with MMPL/SSD domain
MVALMAFTENSEIWTTGLLSTLFYSATVTVTVAVAVAVLAAAVTVLLAVALVAQRGELRNNSRHDRDCRLSKARVKSTAGEKRDADVIFISSIHGMRCHG